MIDCIDLFRESIPGSGDGQPWAHKTRGDRYKCKLCPIKESPQKRRA